MKSTPKSRGSTRKTKAELTRPFDPAIWKRAEEIARTYHLVIVPEPSVDGYLGRTIEFPLVMGDGPTVEACAASVIEATTLAVATILEEGKRPPAAASKARRDQQINIRLTAEEKFHLEQAARSAGFRSLSDYMRAASLGKAS